LARWLTRDLADADDVVQEAYLQIPCHIPSPKLPGPSELQIP
jgi:DNA-directed RNA polymerase specialized sigma24 family protein